MKAILLAALLTTAASAQQTTWRFDNLTTIDGHHATTLGSPTVIDTPLGKALHFNGTATSGDAITIDSAPLAGANTYTFEVIFRPSSKGVPAQRFFHMQAADSQSRRMFELRIVDNKWCLDTVAIDMPLKPGEPGFESHRAVILNCDAAHMHPLDQWFNVTATYDGTTLRGYVNGELQGEASAKLTPLKPGTTSVGTRIDHRDFFTGDIYSARFTPRVLSHDELMVMHTMP